MTWLSVYCTCDYRITANSITKAMINLKAFRKANRIKQEDLANYLKVSRGFISLVEIGSSKLPEDKLEKILANEFGWDTTMLVVDTPSATSVSAKATGNSTASVNIGSNNGNNSTELALLRAEVESLKTQLAKAEAEKEKYWELIDKLMKQK